MSQQHYIPYYEGPPPERPAPARRSRAPIAAAAVAVVAVVATGAVLLVARPSHHTTTHKPHGAMLSHTAVEKFLVDLEDASAPVCNGAADIAATVGKSFTCRDEAQRWTVRITEVEPGGGVRYELVD